MLKTVAILLSLFPFMSIYADPTLIIDTNSDKLMPKRFRIIDNDGLKIIASGQFTKQQLENVKKKIKAPIIVVDLRQESHGFAGDIPISWYGPKNWTNKDKSNYQVEVVQEKLLQKIAKSKKYKANIIYKKGNNDNIIQAKKILLPTDAVKSEKDLVESVGLKYQRFYVADHSPPSEFELDRYKKFLQDIPDDTWIYLHCRGGLGRTSTFSILTEIYKSNNLPSVEQLLKKQADLGGKDLQQIATKKSYKHQQAKARLMLIESEYNTKRNLKNR